MMELLQKIANTFNSMLASASDIVLQTSYVLAYELGFLAAGASVLAGIYSVAALTGLLLTKSVEFFSRAVTLSWLKSTGIGVDGVLLKNMSKPHELLKAEDVILNVGAVNMLVGGAAMLFGYKAYQEYNRVNQQAKEAYGHEHIAIAIKPRVKEVKKLRVH